MRTRRLTSTDPCPAVFAGGGTMQPAGYDIDNVCAMKQYVQNKRTPQLKPNVCKH